MKRKSFLLLGLLACLTACSSGRDTSQLKIVSPVGAPAFAFYNHAENTNYETNGKPSNILAYLTKDSPKDVVVIDTVGGLKAISKGAPFKLAANITFGNFYLAATGHDANKKMEPGDKIILFGKNQTPDKIFHYIYGNEYDANITYVAGAPDAAKALASGKDLVNKVPADYVFLAQPAIYNVLNNTQAPTYGKASIYANIQDLYKEKSGGLELVQASVFVKTKDDKEYNKTLKAFLKNLEKDINKALKTPSVISEKINVLAQEQAVSRYGAPAKVAEAVITDGNGLGLGYKDAFDNKANIDKFISLFGDKPTSEEIYF